MNTFVASYGALAAIPLAATVCLACLLALVLGFRGVRLPIWTLFGAALLWGLAAPIWVWVFSAGVALVFNVAPLRRSLATAPVMAIVRKLDLLPRISDTERIAIEAGTVWVDRELFSGKPDLGRLLGESYPGLTADEQAFLDGPVEEVCRLTEDYEVSRCRVLPREVWDLYAKHRFFGMIIPKEYGGLGFSASANSAVVGKLASRSTQLQVNVGVTNSLGPAELLIRYGTDEQKNYYLPRLARAEEIPCFALTEPGAGSDAGSMTSHGTVFHDDDGELRLRLTWNKRYITLAPVSTLLGLAFQLSDPQDLLGKGTTPGITCALIPTDTPGVDVSLRHDPLGPPFHNGPTVGTDVVVGIDAIIGGVDGAGRGWQMLMECLAAGRGISLPGSAAGGVKMVARVAGAYASVRHQFGMSIGKFEGIQEPLARIAGAAYVLEAARRYTNGALDAHAQPAVITAIAKYNFTELARQSVTDGMDILGGAAIMEGPRNLMASGWAGVPVSITVEGANILTRTLIVFGQGAIRSHPFAYREIEALAANDRKDFDLAFWGHVGMVVRSLCRAVVLGLTRGRLASSPVSGPTARYYRKLAWTSATFALLADLAMVTMGGQLKRKGALTGRFADVFSWMYLGSAVLRRFEAEGRRREDLPLLHWSMMDAFARIQGALEGILQNLDVPLLGMLLRGPVAAFARWNRIGRHPDDRLAGEVARILQTPGTQRDALTPGIYLPDDASDGLGRLEHAFGLSFEAEGVTRKIKAAVRARQLPKSDPTTLVGDAVSAGLITAQEAELLAAAEAARDDAIQVDSLTHDEYMAIAADAAEPSTVSVR
ncbi:MAG TPA: acyl-CoA dehydrogenase [Acidobacteriota bacterium]|nr:acyl-CoA dehydrogenase [Acidobacteriota bacterium]